MALEYLAKIPVHFPFLVLDTHVVMPNHVHGIIYIGPVGAPHVVPEEPRMSAFSKTIPNSLSMIVQQYKSSLKRWCNKSGFSYFQ